MSAQLPTKAFPCDDPQYCWCLGDGHPCNCDAKSEDDCMCFSCDMRGCAYRGPDCSVGAWDGDERVLCPRHVESEQKAHPELAKWF